MTIHIDHLEKFLLYPFVKVIPSKKNEGKHLHRPLS